MPTLIEGLRQRLGLPEDADEAAITAAVDALKATPPEPPQQSLPEGAVAIDAGVLEQLRTDAAAGRDAREQQQTERRQRLVDAAIAEGRTTPAARDAWLNKLAVEGDVAETQLASLAKGLVPVAEKGHDQQPAAQDDLSWFGPAPATTSQEG